MKARRRILVVTRNSGNAERSEGGRCCARFQEQLQAVSAIINGCADEGRVGIYHPGIPKQFAAGGAGYGSVPGVVGDRVKHAGAGDFEDFASGLLVVVVCQMHLRIRKSPAGTGVGRWGNLEVIWG